MDTPQPYRRSLVVAVVAAAIAVTGVRAADPPDFLPDGRFSGSSLTGSQTIGQAEWRAENGEIIGRATGASGGWLLMNQPLQDLQFFANLRCEGPCRTGVLLRAEKTANGLRGIYVSFADGDHVPYRVTIDAQGREVTRTRIGPAPAPGSAAAKLAAASLAAGAWHPIKINLWGETVRSWPGSIGPLAGDEDTAAFGPIAFFTGGTGEVRFKDIAWKDINAVDLPAEIVSDRFTVRRVSEMYYGWSSVSSDVNRDGAMDIISGPFYYLGPTFTTRRLYRADRVYNPATEYAPDMVNFTHDFTGDGWPDILASGWDRQRGTRPIDLYVNPKGEPRRWTHTTVLDMPTSESVLLRDVDGDGQPDLVFAHAAGYAWARPNPANPTAPWTVVNVSPAGQKGHIHGIGGVGDINGDGRMDIVTIAGWYEQPAGGATATPWAFHPHTFGTATTEMGVYDANGDGLTDVVVSLSVHGWGLAWYEQRRAADGTRTFVKHDIATDYSTKNAGGVVFSEAHAARAADMDGDGIPDFVVGKRYWSHLETYNGPDPYGPAVIYIYRTVRNPNAPGGAEFVPELVHNRSGVGSTVEVIDINGDGKPDITTANAYGTHVFLSR